MTQVEDFKDCSGYLFDLTNCLFEEEQGTVVP